MEINIVAVLVAVVATFFLGFLWYTPLFGKVWAKEMGFDANVKPTGGQMTRGLILGLVGNIFLAYVFAHNIMAWTFVPEAEAMTVAGKVFSAVFFTWLGFYLPVDLNTVAWEGKSWKLFAINTSYHFVMLLVAALILILW
jgi:hypothetical protein